MINTLGSFALSLGIVLAQIPSPTRLTPNSNLALQPIREAQEQQLGLDDRLWGSPGQRGDKQALLTSIDNSLQFLRSSKAAAAYAKYPVPGITLDRVRRSLVRFRQLVVNSNSPEELQAAVAREFVFYQSVGHDRRGTVTFTGYYEPIYQASLTPDETYRYPIYRRPPDFESWQRPHPTRLELEGKDGLQGSTGRLRGLELAWLSDRLEAFLIHIQGSARLQLPDGRIMSVGYAGKTDHPYLSVGRELAKDGKLPLSGLSMPVMIDYFRRYPQELSVYLPRYRPFIFFRDSGGSPAIGSTNVPVTAERSIATDKNLMPPGALAFIRTPLPFPNGRGGMEFRQVSRFVLDQDAGSAIKGPGRVDVFMGTGQLAGDRAGVMKSRGQLYYLLLKE
ncbi:murein transglycosylase A [Floridanema aerugineum]|jgi:membrane-bound lytic murein transglycosylase A|uniref:peptidoglycan lytic exotransglycosylase n=1 Tax=Floridaenema aerugineum BLCC-F46 TaxID=3153654 RepID=A0ABV4XIH9_9CYAN